MDQNMAITISMVVEDDMIMIILVAEVVAIWINMAFEVVMIPGIRMTVM